ITLQFRSLRKNAQIILESPGRLMVHMDRCSISFDAVKMVVLDEADEMLNMGFVDDINKILSAVPDERQTLLFSATMPKAIQNLAETYLKEPRLIRMKPTQVTMDLIDQYYIEVQDRQKFDVLCRLLDMHAPDLAIVFGRTKRRVDEVTEGLKKRGYMAEGIHGDLSQQKRDSVIRQFREGTIDILVATDVAARVLDISGVTHVYNYDLPQDPESYVHRVGRTGRAGKAGKATTFVIPREMEHLHAIERLTKRKITRRKAPSLGEVLEGQQRLAVESLISMSDNEETLKMYRSSAEELLPDIDSVTLVSAAIKLLTKEPDTTPVTITEEAPLRVRKPRRFGKDGRRRDGRSYRSGDRRKFDKGGRDRRDGRDRRGSRNARNGRDRRDGQREGKESRANSSFKPYFKD
uniref:DEAD/DEAH box helicase n=1 Tax=Veillonella magna TaxID=464322 RepID=UPI00402AAF11